MSNKDMQVYWEGITEEQRNALREVAEKVGIVCQVPYGKALNDLVFGICFNQGDDNREWVGLTVELTHPPRL